MKNYRAVNLFQVWIIIVKDKYFNQVMKVFSVQIHINFLAKRLKNGLAIK